MPVGQADPTTSLSQALAESWNRAGLSGNRDSVAELWSLEYAGVADRVRGVCLALSVRQQREFIDSFRALAGEWADWAIIRLSPLEPFRHWTEWQNDSMLGAGPAVGNADGTGYTLPMRIFVLPRETQTGAELGNPAGVPKRVNPAGTETFFWPHRSAPVTATRHVLAILRCLLVRNLFNLAVDSLALTLMTLGVISLAGIVTLGARSEVALEGYLAALVAFSACLILYLAWQILREGVLVWREGWFRVWKDSVVRIAGDARDPRVLRGTSYDFAVVVEACIGLARRVLGHDHVHRSRFAAAMGALQRKEGEYAATGRLTGPHGLWVGSVGDIEPKRLAVDEAHLNQFLVPVSRSAIREKVRQAFRPGSGNRARLRLRWFVPAALLKLGGSFRGSSLLAAILLLTFLKPVPDEFGLVARVYPPRLDGPARWWLRTGMRRDVNLLQLAFEGVRGNPSDYFVIVQGSTGESGSAGSSNEKDLNEIVVTGQTSLAGDANHPGGAVADLSFHANAATPDPHRLAVVLFQRRSLAGLPLPPIRVSSFGLPDVEIQP